jgi:hypothetical protein
VFRPCFASGDPGPAPDGPAGAPRGRADRPGGSPRPAAGRAGRRAGVGRDRGRGGPDPVRAGHSVVRVTLPGALAGSGGPGQAACEAGPGAGRPGAPPVWACAEGVPSRPRDRAGNPGPPVTSSPAAHVGAGPALAVHPRASCGEPPDGPAPPSACLLTDDPAPPPLWYPSALAAWPPRRAAAWSPRRSSAPSAPHAPRPLDDQPIGVAVTTTNRLITGWRGERRGARGGWRACLFCHVPVTAQQGG